MGRASHIIQVASVYQSRFIKSPARASVFYRARGFGVAFPGHLAPQANVGNSLFISRDDHLGAFGHGAAVLTASATNAARAGLRIQNFACAAFADGNAEATEYAHHLVVGGIHTLVFRDQDTAEEQENNSSTDDAAAHGKQQSQAHPHRREAGEQISCAAKPGQERRKRRRVERRNTAPARRWIGGRRVRSRRPGGNRRGSPGNRGMCRWDAVPVKVRKMQTAEARASKHERKEAETKTDRKADQIEI